jgi:hypothetical protein
LPALLAFKLRKECVVVAPIHQISLTTEPAPTKVSNRAAGRISRLG